MAQHPADQLNLVADIGGTNTRVALANGEHLLPGSISRYRNREFTGITELLLHYIAAQGGVDCAGACVAVAGPVKDGIGRMTNLDWTVDRDSLGNATKAEKIAILNDLQAQGHALKRLDSNSITPVLMGVPALANAVKLVVGIGTGFNSAVVYDTPKICLVPPSECGHADLPVQTADDLALADFIRKRHGFCAVDDVLSGRGLERMYLRLGAEKGDPVERKAADIMGAVDHGTDPLAEAAVRQFVHLVGVTIGNLALTHLPFGGVFLSGGVARAVAPHLEKNGFETAFHDKGRFRDIMENFSVSVIQDDAAALIGCALFLEA